jgi:hypothetical protein
MDADRKERVARATQAVIDALREIERVKNLHRPAASAKARGRFRLAIEAFANAIGE